MHRKIRAYIPWPVTQFTYTEKVSNKEHRIRVWQANIVETDSDQVPGTILSVDKKGIVVATAKHAIQLQQIQVPGKKAMQVSDVLNSKADWFVVGEHITGLQE